MPPTTRRTFLQESSVGAAVLALGMAGSALGDDKADDKIVMGAIGCGGRGTFLAQSFARHKDVLMAYVCDPDQDRGNKAAKGIEDATGHLPRVVGDLRKVLDDPAVRAVTVATPDHWHGPATLLALDAGKHVYVEKPCSHNIREGRLMVEAARRKQARRAGRHAEPQHRARA